MTTKNIVIVIAIAMVLGGTGWYAYNRFKPKPATASGPPIPKPPDSGDATPKGTVEIGDPTVQFKVDIDSEGRIGSIKAGLIDLAKSFAKQWSDSGQELTEGQGYGVIWGPNAIVNGVSHDGEEDLYIMDTAGNLIRMPDDSTVNDIQNVFGDPPEADGYNTMQAGRAVQGNS